MRIRLTSDLHFEFMEDRGKKFIENMPNDCDVLVLAGDICTVHDGLGPALTQFCKRFPEVVFVCGNHEYFGGTKEDIDELRSEVSWIPNLRWLDKDVWEHKGRRFLGCTLWYKHQPYGLIRRMADPWQIKGLEKWVYKDNAEAEAFLRREMKAGDIVVTHHMPSYRSVHPKYAGSPINPFFVHALDDLIDTARPALWCHGHTHESCDYHIDTTRVVCNPYGYWPEDLNRLYNNDLVLTVGDGYGPTKEAPVQSGTPQS